MNTYLNRFGVGDPVQVESRSRLDRFAAEWKYHHPLAEEQLLCAGRRAVVARYGFYHGGDVVYELDGLPGTWHEPCLRPGVPTDEG